MQVTIGSMIKVYCQGGILETGKVIEYTKDQLVLELIDKSYSIINNPNQNIILIKIFNAKTNFNVEEEVFVDIDLKPERYERREDLRAAGLAELHKLKAAEERKRAREKLTTYQITKQPEVVFGTPDFSKSISQYPKKKIRTSS